MNRGNWLLAETEPSAVFVTARRLQAVTVCSRPDVLLDGWTWLLSWAWRILNRSLVKIAGESQDEKIS